MVERLIAIACFHNNMYVLKKNTFFFFDFETFSLLSVPKLLEFDMLLEVHFIETPEAQAPCVIKYSAPERFTVLFWHFAD